MNKKTFIKEIEKRLLILSDEERKDILEEYENTIDEKINHGKTEEQAVEEFGSIDELAKEILKAYKINPEYKNKDKSDILKDGETFIKKCAQKLTDVTEEIVNNFKNTGKEFNVTTVFEIIIKIMLVLVALLILKLPFYVISHFGCSIFSFGFEPLSTILCFGFRIIIEIIYLVVCALIIIATVNNFFGSKKEKKTSKKKEEIIIKSESRIDVVKEEKKEKISSKIENGFASIICNILRTFLFIIFFIPAIIIQVSLILCLGSTIYILFKGIGIYGILLLLIGIIAIGSFIIKILMKIIFDKGNYHWCSAITGIILIAVGCLMTFDYFININYVDGVPSNIHINTTKYNEIITKETMIPYDKKIVINNELKDNEVILEVTYYDEYYDIVEQNNDGEINIYTYTNSEFSNIKEIYNNFLDNLKDNNIYTYTNLSDILIKVYVNEKTSQLIK